MRHLDLSTFVCPTCHSSLEKKDRTLICPNQHKWKIKANIPRFVPKDLTAVSFGFQWNKHRKTQLDSQSKTTVSEDRFWRETDWTEGELKGKFLLECGSGAGRFTEVICKTGAQTFSIDYSTAVEANLKNNGQFENLQLAQASIYEMPFKRDYFDYLICFGVIQHTPEVRKTVTTMLDHLKPGGKFCFDVYAAPFAYLHPRHILRPITRRIPNQKLYQSIKWIVPKLLPISSALHTVPIIGQGLARLIPIANWKHLGLHSEKQEMEWSILDTFDWYSAHYESPQTKGRIQGILEEYGISELEIIRIRGLYVVRGTK